MSLIADPLATRRAYRPVVLAFMFWLAATSVGLVTARGVEAADDIERWVELSKQAIEREGEQLDARLDEAATELLAIGDALSSAWLDRPSEPDDKALTGSAAFRFLNQALAGQWDPEGRVLGLPLGAQILSGDEVLAWSGWPVPLKGPPPPVKDGEPRFSLRSYGVYHFLSLTGRLPGEDEGVWIIDLPLAHRAELESGEGGLPVLLRSSAPMKLNIIPPRLGRVNNVDSREGESRRLSVLRERPVAGGTLETGLKAVWAFNPSGRDVCELHLQGPSSLEHARREDLLRRNLLGALLFLLCFSGGLALRWGLRRLSPGGMPLLQRSLFISLFIVGLRLILVWSRLPERLFPGSGFWTPEHFALAGLGGAFASPGEFLVSALAALLVLLLVLRPYARPREALLGGGEFPEVERRPAPRGLRLRDLPRVLPAILLPALAVLTAQSFASLIFANCSSSILFEARLLDPIVFCLNVALFFALSFLLAVFLVPSISAWKQLPLSRSLRLPLALLMLLGVGLLGDVYSAAALALLLPITWKMKRAASRLTGLVYYLLFIVISLALLATGSVRHERESHLRCFLTDALRIEDKLDLIRPVMLEEILIELGRDEGLRRELARGGSVEPGLAQALWRSSALQELGMDGGLEIYDDKGRLRDSFQWGIDLPVTRMHAVISNDRSDLWAVVEQEEKPRGDTGRPMLEGMINLREAGETLGTLELIMADRRRHTPLLLSRPPWRGGDLLERGAVVPGEEELFIAKLDGRGAVVGSSAPSLLPDGMPLPADLGDSWLPLSLGGRSYRVARLPGGLVGYLPPQPLEILLEAALRLFIYLIILLVLFILDILFSRIDLVRRYLPPLIGEQGFGFQHKLLGAFLLVAVLPTLLTGLIAGQQLSGQYDEATLRSSLERVLSARFSLESRVRQDAQKLLRSEYVQNFITQAFPAVARDTGSFEENQIMVFDGADSLILDESLRNWGRTQVDSFLTLLPRDKVVYERSGSKLYAGILLPLDIISRARRHSSTVYYRMLLGDEMLRNMSDVIGGDLSLFGGGRLLRSNQSFLYGLGYSSPMLDSGTVNDLLLGGQPYRQDLRHAAGDLSFGQASLALPDAAQRPVAVLSSLDFSGLASRREAQERSFSVVLSMLALLVILALGLGGFLAGRVFLPIHRLHLGTRRLAAGDLSYRLQPLGGDEIGDLVRSFNTMAGGLQETRQALEERRRYLEVVLENVASGVLILDLSGRVLSANSAARRLLGLNSRSLEGRDLLQLARRADWPALDPSPLFRLLIDNPPQLAHGGKELGLSHSDGRRSFRVASSAMPAGRVVVFEDVTDLIRSQKLAAWSEMARQVAHEIKNPLTPIKLSTQFMERAWRDRNANFDEIFRESIDIIKEQVEILRRRASEFSLFGRRPEIQLTTLDLAATTRKVLAPYTSEAMELHWEGDEQVPVLADLEALSKVLLNLVENAREAMGGAGRLDCVCRSTSEGGLLLMRDHGAGIPEETLDRLFEPYFSTKTGGTGLGLAISAQTVDEMGGSLGLENHPEGGAVARLLLPGAKGTGTS